MSQISDQASVSKPAHQATPAGRRRPGRWEEVNPALIPLLRRDRLLEGALAQCDGEELGAARGMVIGVVIGLLLWGAIALLAWWLLVG